MNQEQRELARHALGLPNKNRKSYRNHYVTGKDTPEHALWMQMCRKWLATSHKGSELTGGDTLFRLTREGANAALAPREKLDPEDFPDE